MIPGRKINVVHFQRRQRPTGNYSVELIFSDVRDQLKGRVNFSVVFAKHYSNGLIKRIINILHAFKYQGAVNHITGDIHYINYLLPREKTILTILDCGFMNCQNLFKRVILGWLWLKIPVWKSKYITVISEATKRDVIKYTGCAPGMIYIIPIAVPTIFVPTVREFNKHCPVLLQVGTLPNKNVERLIEAISTIKCKLIIIGELNERQQYLLKSYSINYTCKSNLTPKQMNDEYNNCDLVTFVSTFEGFGMPIIEANCTDRPVIAGNNSSMPEVGGKAAYYVDAFSVEKIRSGIERIIQDKDLRETLVSNGRLNRLRFDNSRIADLYYQLYDKVENQ